MSTVNTKRTCQHVLSLVFILTFDLIKPPTTPYSYADSYYSNLPWQNTYRFHSQLVVLILLAINLEELQHKQYVMIRKDDGRWGYHPYNTNTRHNNSIKSHLSYNSSWDAAGTTGMRRGDPLAHEGVENSLVGRTSDSAQPCHLSKPKLKTFLFSQYLHPK